MGGVTERAWVKGPPVDTAFLDLELSERFAPVARLLNLSMARPTRRTRSFLAAYRAADGDPSRLPKRWHHLRRRVLTRLMNAAKREGDPMWRYGVPTRRHVALICWGYSPTPTRLRTHKYATAA
jgi:hypothetical protein